MNYLLDTCIVSELIKKKSDKKIINWISTTPEIQLYISVFTIAEIHKGITKLPRSKRKDELHKWVNTDLKERFKNRVINFNTNSATEWGRIQGEAELSGNPMSLIDGLIASIALTNDLILVTRNVKDFEQSGVVILNPWTIS